MSGQTTKTAAFILALLSPLAMSGCATRSGMPGSSEPAPQVAQSQDAFSKPEAMPPMGPGVSARPMPKIGLLLGPGGARALAHAGVLKTLTEARLPIHAIVGLEFGALPGALFAQRGQVNELEWHLFRLEQMGLGGGWFRRGTQEIRGGELEKLLNEAFRQSRLEQARIPFSCPVFRAVTGQLQWLKFGEFREVLPPCLSYPPLLSAHDGRVAAAGALQESIKELRTLGAELVILVDVLGERAILPPKDLPAADPSAILWLELRRQLRSARTSVDDVVIVEGPPLFARDFQQRKDLQRAGEDAAKKLIARLNEKFDLGL